MKLELGIEISHETIDGYIWADKKSGGRIYKFLRTKGKKYRSRGISIDDRPKIVDEKSRIGIGRSTPSLEKTTNRHGLPSLRERANSA